MTRSGRSGWYVWPEARHWRCSAVPDDTVRFHQSLAEYAHTPLTELPTLADELRVGRVLVKDESARLGLPAFKALGASWAIYRALARQLVAAQGPIPPGEWMAALSALPATELV